MKAATVLLSGGQDSVTCLYWTLAQDYDRVFAVSFDYGQRHRVELDLARRHAVRADVADYAVLPVEALGAMGAASLTNELIQNDGEGDVRNVYAEEHGLPPSFVPGRNVVFFALAAAWGAIRGADTIVSGVCAQDRAGYPDCRAEFVDAQAKALREALDLPTFGIVTPLLFRSKAETWQLADDLGIVSLIREETNTCYEGDRSRLNAWGYGCGRCGACVERERGWNEWQASLAAA